MRILVVNTGSSSLKLSVVTGSGDTEETATVERWDGEHDLAPVRDFLDRAGSLDAVGHRVVHGGPDHSAAARVTDELLDDLEGISHLAPLHNPRAVAGIRAVEQLLDAPAVACFDTAFHVGMPAAAATYALPREWNRRWQLRRYGFHGLSHAWAVRRAADLVAQPVDRLRLVSCHLGAGASLAAVRGGQSVDTTMGFTPLAGLVMQTRSGSVDPGLLLWLLREAGLSPEALAEGLERESGLKGLSGTGGDVRDVLSGIGSGDSDCALAYGVFVHRLVREAAGMAAAAGGVDVLVLTGGIGEHAVEVRRDLAAGLGHLGVALDPSANDAAAGDADISGPGAAVRTVVVTSREDLEIARQVRELLG